MLATGRISNYAAPFFMGDPWDWKALVDMFTRKSHRQHGTALWRALCGIDTAVYNMLGKATSRPHTNFWAGQFGPLCQCTASR